VALLFLVNMEFAWWEAVAMLALFAVQFILPAIFGPEIRHWITMAFLGWTTVGLLLLAVRRPKRNALSSFIETWRAHVSSAT
jgi:ABC-type iron transport system FetAB permease component